MTVFIEGDDERSGGNSLTSTDGNTDTCTFVIRQYNAEIDENRLGRQLLIDLNATCEISNNAHYSISQGSGMNCYIYYLSNILDEFDIDTNTGQLYAISPLDREKRSLHFIIVNVSRNDDNNQHRNRRQLNPAIERLLLDLSG